MQSKNAKRPDEDPLGRNVVHFNKSLGAEVAVCRFLFIFEFDPSFDRAPANIFWDVRTISSFLNAIRMAIKSSCRGLWDDFWVLFKLFDL